MERDKLKASGRKARTAPADGATQPQEALSPEEEVVIVLGGREFAVREMNLADAIRIGRDHGNVEEFLARLGMMDPEAIAYFAWLMIRRNDPKLTPESVAELLPVREDRLTPLLTRICEAAGLTEPADGGTDPNAPRPATTGPA